MSRPLIIPNKVPKRHWWSFRLRRADRYFTNELVRMMTVPLEPLSFAAVLPPDDCILEWFDE